MIYLVWVGDWLHLSRWLLYALAVSSRKLEGCLWHVCCDEMGSGG
jgi:hypothetical protein